MPPFLFFFFFFNDTATTEIYTLSLHDALPILDVLNLHQRACVKNRLWRMYYDKESDTFHARLARRRSEEHTSELQSLAYLVCRLLLEKKKKKYTKKLVSNIKN